MEQLTERELDIFILNMYAKEPDRVLGIVPALFCYYVHWKSDKAYRN
jgi:hypothetical protein